MSVIKEKMKEAQDNGLKEDLNREENMTDLVQKDEMKYILSKKNWELGLGSKKKILIISISVILAIVLILGIVAVINLTSKSIFKNISIAGINVSDLTKEEAIQKLNSVVDERLNVKQTMKYEDKQFIIEPKQIDANYNVEETVENAYSVGRYGNVLKNNIDMLKSFFVKQEIPLTFNYSEEKLQAVLNDVNSNFSELVQSSYEIVDGKLVIKKGQRGAEIKKEVLSEKLLDNILNGKTEEIQVAVVVVDPKTIDIEAIHKEIYKEPVNATYTKEPFEIHKHQDGVDFGISLDEAKALLEQEKEEYVIPLKYTKPKITTDNIGSEAFPDLLAKFSTTYAASNVNRTTNLRLASNKINGTILLPGETFSYNKVVGRRTEAAGFKEANMYSGGEVVQGLGGGICQISSTLYNIVLSSNLGIVERHNHQFLPGYVVGGKDATVVYGSLDFKFKNTRNYPVKIVASVGGGYATMKMYGTKEANEYDVSIETTVHQTIYPAVSYQDTNTLKEGETKVIDKGQNGGKISAYRVLKQNGKVVSRTLLSTDTYSAMKKVVLRGTKKTTTPPVDQKPVDPKPEPPKPVDPKPEVPETPETPETPGGGTAGGGTDKPENPGNTAGSGNSVIEN